MYVAHQLSATNRRKGWTISFIIHALLLLLCFFPFMFNDPLDEEISHAIQIQFEQFTPPVITEDMGSAMSGAEAAALSAPAEAAPEAQESRAQVKVEQVSTIQPSSALSTPSRNIITSEATPDVVLPQSKSTKQSNSFFEQSLDVEDRVEVDRVEAFKAKPNPALQQKVTWVVADVETSGGDGKPSSMDFPSGKGTGTGTGGQGTKGSAPDGQGEDGGHDPFADGSFPGGKGSGTGNAGKDTGTGNQGKGMKVGYFAGDGLFNRKVIKRNDAEIAKAAAQPGKVVINLCVDQTGRVVFAQYDIPNSSIKDKAIATKVEAAAKLYIFDEDPSVQREQCGRLTFLFELPKN